MKHFAYLFGAAVLFFAASLTVASPVRKTNAMQKQEKVNVGPFDTSFPITDSFKGGEASKVIAIGDGLSFLGLYVYDSYGNCVAWDDEANFSTRDDLAVEWFPGTNGDYTVELRNFGINSNKVSLLIR